ncbi:MAG: DNA replication/repair protein RecF [Frisingicoccus sp.]|nr:DNA replication/repair protein RecF [Frisingicoccus sp.]
MIIKSLELLDYRNYENLQMDFDPGTNILYGNNAQGKTNILESIYVCATTKSHRGSRDKEMIRFGQDDAHIRMFIEKRGIEHKIDIHLKKNKTKGVAIDGLPIRKSSELMGMVNVVFFSPEDLTIIKNGPSERRHFIDMELCQLNKVYLYDISNYNKVVNQRNNLLKQSSYEASLKDTLDVWDMQLIRYGKKIIQQREKFIEQLNELIHPIHKKLSGGKENLELRYEPNVTDEDFEEQLFLHRDGDMKLRSTTVGPHRDDMGFYIDGINVRRFGSQGQQRTAALSLKLAEIDLVKQFIKDTPILLLDDVLSELDSFRQNYLLESIRQIQTVVTCTGLDEFINSQFNIDKIFRVKNGSIEREKQEVKDE